MRSRFSTPSGFRRRLRAGLALLALALVLAACGGRAPEEGARPPNILLIVTDDQRWDTLDAMPRLRAALGPRAVRFENALVTNPVCCPFRSSLLAGGYYSQDTGVLAATPPNGAAPRFDDQRSLGTLLQTRGYRTGLIGKYLNRYDLVAPRVPPGWDHFFASTDPHDWYRTPWIRGTSGTEAAVGSEHVSDRHITRVERAEALAFLQAEDDRPFFLLVATHAPHRPAIAPAKDLRRYRDFEYRDRAWGEVDLGDKPDYVRRRSAFFDRLHAEGGRLLDLPRRQLASLQLVDRLVLALLRQLEESGEAERTVVVFTSDNGMLWGEHRLYTKAMPYEESIRVPLWIRAPGSERASVESLVAVDLDVAATVLDYAGVSAAAAGLPESPGRSLRPWLEGREGAARGQVLLEGFGVDPDITPAWVAVRTARWKYVEYATGEGELYDLEADPFEEDSLHAVAEHDATRRDLAERLDGFAGLAMTDSVYLPAARVGEPWAHPFGARGGRGVLRWRHVRGHIPRGLELSPEGRLHGTPERAGEFRLTLEVEDSSVSPLTGRPRTFERQFHLTIAP